MGETYVALDLETTGLNPEGDEIIEVGAVKFEEGQVVDTFHSLVNPHHPLPYRIQVLCGITQAEVDGAPPFSAISDRLLSFLDAHPLVGHNVSFDLGFLSQRGVILKNPALDTLDLAALLLPGLPDYSLSSVARRLQISRTTEHRALADATAAKEVFVALLERAGQLHPLLLEEVALAADRVNWGLGKLFRDLGKDKGEDMGREGALVSKKPQKAKPLTPRLEKEPLDIEMLRRLLGAEGPLAQALPHYEERREQVEMMQAIARALNEGHHLIVEAGTGTGKSLAYLLPVVFFSLQNGVPVVISTNTINLQEQLMGKDIPDLLRALGKELRAVQLKGRGNYLCLRRWAWWRTNPPLSPAAARLIGRILIWLPQTESGDRAELNLTGEETATWSQLSAQAESCLGGQCSYHRDSGCFLHRARKAAENAHIIVVNHALLLSDLVAQSKILPDHRHLIIDEAHHLEEGTTRQLGSQVTERDIAQHLASVSEERPGERQPALVPRLKGCLRSTTLARQRQERLERLAAALERQVQDTRSRVSQFFSLVRDFVDRHSSDSSDYDRNLRLTRSSRTQPGWAGVEIAGESLNLALRDLGKELDELFIALEDSEDSAIPDYENLLLELSLLLYRSREFLGQLESLVSHPNPGDIYWVNVSGPGETVSLCTAPLEVGRFLRQNLFSAKDSVILTGATLSTEGTFEYIKGRLGLEDAEELLLGAPFDYASSALIYIPVDLPGPTSPGYQPAMERLLIELCCAAQGRTLVLFTSHAALRSTQTALQPSLEQESILVLGQGIDGSPKQLLNFFRENSRTVLLGTASFWEGVDIVGEAVSLLVIARLPFNVPTEPVFAARSELFDDPFNEYTLPQAALRFKQGFGRLIRSRSDRGVLVVLDSRIHAKPYGSAFLASLPPCTVVRGNSRNLPAAVTGWLGVGGGPPLKNSVFQRSSREKASHE